MKKIPALLAGLFLCINFLAAQNPAALLKGIVTNEHEELLVGATVFWKDTKAGTVTDTSGRFTLPTRSAEQVRQAALPGVFG